MLYGKDKKMKEQNHPNVIKIRNAHVHNLKHINVDIPLNKLVGIAGVSGSGNPKYIWNRIGTVKHIMTDVFKTCKSQFKTL